jgi:hypothetical protein
MGTFALVAFCRKTGMKRRKKTLFSDSLPESGYQINGLRGHPFAKILASVILGISCRFLIDPSCQ